MNVELIIENLVNLRKKIGANLLDLEFKFEHNDTRAKMIEALENGGIELENLSELEIANDDTFIYHGRRVILHIRDVSMYHNDFNLPKYHLINCQKYQEMVSANRKGRYVIASRDNGLFDIKKITGNDVQLSQEKLELCKYCLNKIGSNILGRDKNMYIKRFFERYPKDYEFGNGHEDDKTAKTNVYADDWSIISLKKRTQVEFICQKCHKNFYNNKGMLDVHHKNGQKNDNRDENLIVLCRECHSMEPMHEHMKYLYS